MCKAIKGGMRIFGRLDHDVSGMGLGSNVKSLYPLTCFGKALRCGGLLGRYLEDIPRCLGIARRAYKIRAADYTLDRSVLSPFARPSTLPTLLSRRRERARAPLYILSLFFHTSHITVHIANAISPCPTTADLDYPPPCTLPRSTPLSPYTSTTFDRLFDLILLYSRFYFAWHYPEQTRTSPFHTPSFTLIVFPLSPLLLLIYHSLHSYTALLSPFQLHRITTVSH